MHRFNIVEMVKIISIMGFENLLKSSDSELLNIFRHSLCHIENAELTGTSHLNDILIGFKNDRYTKITINP